MISLYAVYDLLSLKTILIKQSIQEVPSLSERDGIKTWSQMRIYKVMYLTRSYNAKRPILIFIQFQVQFGINLEEYYFQRVSKLHEPERQIEFVLFYTKTHHSKLNQKWYYQNNNIHEKNYTHYKLLAVECR